eukprot:gb/GECH01013093.1/.p1 GENE.gb/GECH01013093.1/~~gb/GECH01013093.1/.p1  ORF type:complete len:385 (+),score=54.71 gb/GECH01013093.1/:1-1155(+)
MQATKKSPGTTCPSKDVNGKCTLPNTTLRRDKDEPFSKCLFEDSVPTTQNSNIKDQHTTQFCLFSQPKILKELWKTNLSGMVAMTAYVGRGLVQPSEQPLIASILPSEQNSLISRAIQYFVPGALFFTGTFLLSGASITINQIMERDKDKLMIRTQKRPLPTKRVSISEAAISSVIFGAAGAGLLYISSNKLTTSLGIANLFIYTAMYTPLKTRHWLNTWFGAIVGAIPPVMGCTAVSNNLKEVISPSIIWGGILALWQIPHFMALSIMCKKDYSRAGYHMLGLQNPKSAGSAAIIHTIALFPLCVAAPYLDVTNWWFLPSAGLCTAYFTKKAIRFYQEPSGTNARRLFFTSLFYLGAVSGALLATSKEMGLGKTINGFIKQFI